MNIPAILKTKTFKACFSTAITAAGAYYGGYLDLGSALQLLATSVIGVFLRQGILTGSPAVPVAPNAVVAPVVTNPAADMVSSTITPVVGLLSQGLELGINTFIQEFQKKAQEALQQGLGLMPPPPK